MLNNFVTKINIILTIFTIIISYFLWFFFDTYYIFYYSFLLIIFYFILQKIIKLLKLKIKKEPGASVNLKISLSFIAISCIPLILTLYFTIQLMNQFIETIFQKSLVVKIESLVKLSKEKLNNQYFINYIQSKHFIEVIKKNLFKESKPEVNKKNQYLMNHSQYDFILIYSMNKDSKKLNLLNYFVKKGLELEIKTTLDKIFQNFIKENNYSIIKTKVYSQINDEINIFYAIIKIDSTTIIFTGKKIDPLDIQIAKNIQEIRKIYAQKEITKNQAINDFQIIIFLIGLPTLLIAILLSLIIASTSLKPIEKLIIGTKQIAQGNLKYHIEENIKGELGELIKSFNHMSDELQSNKDQLYRIGKIAAWREVAKKIAHEIKNPLTPIKLASERMQRQYKLNKDNFSDILNSCSSIIISEVNRLGKLVDEFSDFARQTKLNLKSENIFTIINEMYIFYKTSHPNIKITLNNFLNKDKERILIDKEKIKQVFINLIENSISFSKENLHINIDIYFKQNNQKEYCHILFTDNGLGITAKNISQVFEPYYTTKKGGSGLGLSIVKNIVEEHKGSIIIESKINKGTQIFIELPYLKKVSEVK